MELSSLRNVGFQHYEAWEMVRERHLLLPPLGQLPSSSTFDQANTGPSLTGQILEATHRGQSTFPVNPEN